MNVRYVYIAGPYTPDPDAFVQMHMQVYHLLLDWGYYPFCPVLSHFPDTLVRQRHYEDWMDLDLAWIKRSDALLRITKPIMEELGYGDWSDASPGADREEALAHELGIPVFRHLDWLKYNAPKNQNANLPRVV